MPALRHLLCWAWPARHDRVRRRSVAFALCFVWALPATWPKVAFANGAFPDSLGILLPSDQPQRIVAATNFGLVVSSDAGRSWQLICEAAIGRFPTLYQQGRAPQSRLLAVTASGLAWSGDGGCSWAKASGPFDDTDVTDAFADPSDGAHVLLLAARAPTDTGRSALFESHDAAKSFGPPLYSAAEGLLLTGVEIARSDPKTVYLSMYDGQLQPYLAHSADAGKTWTRTMLAKNLNAWVLRILAVDPQHPEIVYLRSSTSTADELVRYDQHTGQATRLLSLPSRMTAFLQRSNGTLLVGMFGARGFVSHDGGKSFADWPNVPHLRGLGERAGKLYAVADNTLDGYAVAESTDEGASWRPLLNFDDLHALASCPKLAATCSSALSMLHMNLETVDAGAPYAVAMAMASSHHGGSGCSVARQASQPTLHVVLMLLTAAVLARRRRRAHHTRSAQPRAGPCGCRTGRCASRSSSASRR